jgi:hypothetical protein
LSARALLPSFRAATSRPPLTPPLSCVRFSTPLAPGPPAHLAGQPLGVGAGGEAGGALDGEAAQEAHLSGAGGDGLGDAHGVALDVAAAGLTAPATDCPRSAAR